MRTNSSSVNDDFLYKRRKLQRNTVALLSASNVAGVTEKNNHFDFNLSSSDYHLVLHENSSDGAQRPLAEEFTNELCCTSTGNCNATSDTLATPKSNISSVPISKAEEEHGGDRSNYGAIHLNSLEMCSDVLKRHELLGDSRSSAGASPKNLGSVGPVFSPCKICRISENVRLMLICDCCEEAFHLSCCIPKIKILPKDQWYCQSCFTEKRKPLLRKIVGTPSYISDSDFESGGPISSMLRSIHPLISRARIGDDFQVEVSNWSGPIYNDDDYFGKPKELDHVDCCSLESWRWNNPLKSSSTGNWLQCKAEDDEGNICGKWRRAPLFSVQTDDWDCSSALLWDPIHADCSVSQELDTEEVLKQLKYVQVLRNRLNKRMKAV